VAVGVGVSVTTGAGVAVLVAVAVAVLALVAAAAGLLLNGRDDGESAGSTTTTTGGERSATTDPDRTTSTTASGTGTTASGGIDPTNLFGDLLGSGLGGTSTASVPPSTAPPSTTEGQATAEQVDLARLTPADVGAGYAEQPYAADAGQCGQSLDLGTAQQASAASFGDPSGTTVISHRVQSFADGEEATAQMASLRGPLTQCPTGSTVVDGTSYTSVVQAYPSAPTYCDDSMVLLHLRVTMAFDGAIRLTGAIRCGRNVATVDYAVEGLAFSPAQEAAFYELMLIAYDRLAKLPR
jgi:hypothetical protein